MSEGRACGVGGSVHSLRVVWCPGLEDRCILRHLGNPMLPLSRRGIAWAMRTCTSSWLTWDVPHRCCAGSDPSQVPSPPLWAPHFRILASSSPRHPREILEDDPCPAGQVVAHWCITPKPKLRNLCFPKEISLLVNRNRLHLCLRKGNGNPGTPQWAVPDLCYSWQYLLNLLLKLSRDSNPASSLDHLPCSLRPCSQVRF